VPHITPTFILPPKNVAPLTTGTTIGSGVDLGLTFSELLAGEMQELTANPELVPKPDSTEDTQQSLLTELQNRMEQLAIGVIPFVPVARVSASSGSAPDATIPEAVMQATNTKITDGLIAVESEKNAGIALLAPTKTHVQFAEADEFVNLNPNPTSKTAEANVLKHEFAEKAPAPFSPKPVTSDTSTLAKETIHNDLSVQQLNNASPGLNEVQPTTIANISASNFAVGINNASNVTQTIHQRVGTPGWDQALGQKINWMVLGGQQSASLTLNPPDLGPLQVVIHVNNQHADATFIAHQPEVRAALESAIPKLREMLEQSGIQLGDCNVNSQTSQQQEFAHRQVNPGRLPGSVNNLASNVEVIRPSHSVSGGIGLVDTFV